MLVGIRSKENMQAMISSKSFNGQVISCIVDSTGQVIISPTDLKPFLQLDDIFRKEKDSKVKSDIYQMQSDMHKMCIRDRGMALPDNRLKGDPGGHLR